MFNFSDYKPNQILFDGATELEHYTVIDTRYNNRPARVLYTDNRMAAQSAIALDEKPELLFDYNQRFIELVEGLRPKKILLIGGGAFTLPTAISERFPDIKLDVFELDGGLITIASRYFGYKPSENIRVYIGDGAELINQIKKTYDLILIDVFKHTEVPKIFLSRQFAKAIKSRLNVDGTVVMNVIASYYGERAEIMEQINHALESSFNPDNMEIFPAGDAISLWVPQNFIVTAQINREDLGQYLSYKALTKDDS